MIGCMLFSIYDNHIPLQADKEWRVVTEYLDELIEEYEQQSKSSDKDAAKMLHSIDIENMQAANRPRPLKFDPDKHKVRWVN